MIMNGAIKVLNPGGLVIPGFDYRPVQLVDSDVGEDPGMVEIVAGGSSAMAPMISLKIIDMPDPVVLPEVPLTTGAYQDPAFGPYSTKFGSKTDPALNYKGSQYGYNRDGLIYVLEQWGQGEWPLITPGPWHILRVQRPPGLIASVNVRAARVDFLTNEATWYQHITIDMPDAFRTAAWQPDLQQLLDTGDGSLGIGVGTVVNGRQYLGYLPGVKVQLGVNEYAQETRQEALGLVDYEHPVIIYERPLKFSKFDIIALGDGRRLLVSDLVHRFQRLGVTLAVLQMTEYWPDVNSLIYQVN